MIGKLGGERRRKDEASLCMHTHCLWWDSKRSGVGDVLSGGIFV